MKAAIGVLATLAAVLFVGGPAGGSPTPTPAVLALVSEDGESLLARLEASSLEMRPGEAVSLGRPTFGLGRSATTWAFAPDAGTLAVGGRLLGGVRFVDLQSLRVVGRMTRAFEPLAWLTPRRLLAAEQGDPGTAPDTLLGIDTITYRVVARRTLGGVILRTERMKDRLALLLAPRNKIGVARVAVADSRGAVRKVTLGRISAGSVFNPRTHSGRFQSPGLAVDPVAARAFVVGRRLVAEIDVRTMTVRYHSVGGALAVLKGYSEGSTREARWVGDGLVAVSGSDSTVGDRPAIRPVGLRLIDTRAWTLGVLDKRASSFVWADGSLLAFGPARNGLSAYGLDGRMRLHVLGEEPIPWVQALDGYAYVQRTVAGGLVVELGSGATHEPVRSSIPVLLVPGRPAY